MQGGDLSAYNVADDTSSAGAGLYGPQSGYTPRELDAQSYPITGSQAAKYNFELGFSSKWNLTYDAGRALDWGYSNLADPGSGAEETEDYKRKQRDLESEVQRLPNDKKSWLNTQIPNFAAGLLDPLTLATVGGAEKVFSTIAPRAIAAASKALPAGTSLTARAARGLLTGSAKGAFGGAVSGAVAAGLNESLGTGVSWGQYMDNITSWTGMGALGGGIGAAWTHFLPREVKAHVGEGTEAQNANPLHQQAVTAAADDAVEQTNSDKVVNNEATYAASLGDYQDKVANHVGELEDKVTALQAAKDHVEDSMGSTLTKLMGHYPSLDDLADAIHRTPLPHLLETVKNIDRITPALGDSKKPVKDILSALNEIIPSSGSASRVSAILDKPEQHWNKSELDLLKKLQDPVKELDERENYSNKISTPKQQKVINRLDSLRKYDKISKQEHDKFMGNEILPQLNDHAHTLNALHDELQIAKSNVELASSPKFQVEQRGNTAQREFSDPDDNMTSDDSSMTTTEAATEDRPYQTNPVDYQQMDDRIKQLQDQGLISEEDLEPVREADEDTDEGQQTIVNIVANCLLGE